MQLALDESARDVVEEGPEVARRHGGGTCNQELDKALANLDPLLPPAVASPATMVPLDVIDEITLPQVTASAAIAFNCMQRFRIEVIHGRVTRLIEWLKRKGPRNFKISDVQTFGSFCYDLQLATSDIDIAVTLAAGQDPQHWLKALATVTQQGGDFTIQPKPSTRIDTLQTEFMLMPVDIKPIKSRQSDGACRSTDCLAFMISERKEQEDGFEKKRQAIIIFKLLCHYLHVVQHHCKARATKFKAITLCYWAIAVLDGKSSEDKLVGDLVLFLCNQFLRFDWQYQKVTVSAAGAIDICDKGNLIGAVCIMLDDGTSKSTSNVDMFT